MLFNIQQARSSTTTTIALSAKNVHVYLQESEPENILPKIISKRTWYQGISLLPKSDLASDWSGNVEAFYTNKFF